MSDYLQYVVLNDMSGRELQVRKANYISWKINNKRRYRPSDSIRHKGFVNGFLQVNNARYVISSHYVQRGHRREFRNEIGNIRGKTCFF